MKKLGNRGFARPIFLVALAAVLVVAAAASFVIVRHNKSNAGGSNTIGASACGSGYKLASTSGIGAGSGHVADVYIMANPSLHKACGVVVSVGSQYGVTKPLSAQIFVADTTNGANTVLQGGGTSSGNYKYYAGPVFVSYANVQQSLDNAVCVKASVNNGDQGAFCYNFGHGGY